ncbi:serine/threonine-protein kinase pim-2-like [Boleophthalmus pectinirostris]|uniref:serine/threonine-protein kinase pim-2-like n=1 Tax=Boleophthalmus pectinirostris TaxID=150288 RepID=UPI002431F1EE|nr:serine/threonine-protein kinase pim-2-like [Boleophthalmus pectinirostris]
MGSALSRTEQKDSTQDSSRLRSSDEDESGSDAKKRPLEEQIKLERPADYNTLSDTEDTRRPAPRCSNDASSSTPGPSEVLACSGPSVAPNTETKRKSQCSEEEDEEQRSPRKKSKTDDAPKERTRWSERHFSRLKRIWMITTEEMEEETQAASTPTCADELSKKYTWAEILQEGGFGKVFSGVRIEDNLPVALKFIKRTMVTFIDVEMDGVPVRLPKEVYFLIRAGAGPTSSDSRVTPQLLDWYELYQDIVLVLERPVPCLDLVDYFENVDMSPDMAKIIFRQLVDEAIELESKGIFHRDIKPENVLLETGSDVPRARFIDFGCATFFTPGQEFTDPQGTLDYSSPECFCGQSYTAGPTTVWQLSVLLFVMLFKRLPLSQEENIGSVRVVPIPTCIPQGCRDLLRGCLKEDPEERLTLQDIKDHPWCQYQLKKKTSLIRVSDRLSRRLCVGPQEQQHCPGTFVFTEEQKDDPSAPSPS